ncbi:beta-propeller fold lactonase family protein [Paenarthrobacter sp. PH39-S1]|uniref:YncE family protein n=1 Tax=Paenarthrobacter sp. PH39-S1 TaxID=3046204 RepID=UPI0024BA7339|nr:beta-propeller fold lactonase family protein [Paenarthrobacter sp. PH39-S1]
MTHILTVTRRAGIAVIAGAALVLLSACGGGVQGAASSSPAAGTSTAQIMQAPALPGAQSISSRDRVYTADQTSNTVTVINPATNEVLGTIPLGAQRLGDTLGPQYLRDVDVHGLGFSRDGQYLDAVSVTTNTVTVIRTADNSIVSQTNVGRSSHEGFFSPDGQTVWVADRALSQLDIVDALHGGVIGHVNTDAGPSKVLFSPDGRKAYVNHLRSATIDVIDVTARKVVDRITGLADSFSSDMALSPDGHELWAAHKKAGKVSVIDVPGRRVTAVVDSGAGTNHPAFVSTPQAGYVYLTVGGTDETKVYQRNGHEPPGLIGTIQSSGVEPHGIWPSPDNTRVYIVNEHSDSVDVIDTADRSLIKTLRVGQEGQALVYVANAVPTGTGSEHLTRQGLDQPVENAEIKVDGPGEAHLTVRAVDGLDMIEIEGQGLTPNTRYTASVDDAGEPVPLLSFTTDPAGTKPQALAYVQFLGVHDIHAVTVTPSIG